MSFKTIFIASALAASSLVSAAVLPRQASPSTGPTCADKNPLDKFLYTATSKKQFEVVCGADYYGSDIGDVQWPGSFEGCLELCDANADCQAVSWTGACYLKGGVPALNEKASNVWTAKKAPAPTCDGPTNSDGAVFPTASGDFEIICGKDYGGNDLDATDAKDFADCINICAANVQCVDVAFNYGRCYLKKALGDLSVNAGVWTAKRVGTTTAPAVPTPQAPAALSCVDNKDDTHVRGNFTVQCGNDHYGADIGAISGTFEECIDACNANKECQVVSWVWGTCYMKNAVNDGQTGVSHVWGAVRTSALATPPVAEPQTPAVPAETEPIPAVPAKPETAVAVEAAITPVESTSAPDVSTEVDAFNLLLPFDPARIPASDLDKSLRPATLEA
ncbi:hypothetical protein N0V86_006619 [Didymella sp. IMI 355093]|nr:hypothetical protein N0V86_006619 [Didymella sp. IMI 355093]